jgi:hypothetical protein
MKGREREGIMGVMYGAWCGEEKEKERKGGNDGETENTQLMSDSRGLMDGATKKHRLKKNGVLPDIDLEGVGCPAADGLYNIRGDTGLCE